MHRDHVPSWLTALIAIFGLAALICLFLFLQFHAQEAAHKNTLVEHERLLIERRREVGLLEDAIRPLESGIRDRQARLAEFRALDADEQTAIRGVLIPNHQTVLARIRDLHDSRHRTFQTRLNEARRAREELNTVQEQALADEKAADAERAQLRRAIERESQAVEELRRSQRDEILALEEQVAERQARVEELLARREIKVERLTQDGTVLRADVNNGFVIIDRGLDHHLFPGTTFVVFQRQGGVNRVKGEIQVMESEPRMAVARVLSEHDANNPIIPGDLIHNPIFHPDETKNYVVAGTFVDFSRNELRRFIEDAGGNLQNQVGRSTHYLVAGADAEEAVTLAIINGVTIISEQKLMEMVRRTERFRIRRGMNFVLAGKFPNQDEAAIRRFIQLNGGRITGSLRRDTHVLIAGEGAGDAVAEARMQGVQIINSDQLTHLMGTSIEIESK